MNLMYDAPRAAACISTNTAATTNLFENEDNNDFAFLENENFENETTAITSTGSTRTAEDILQHDASTGLLALSTLDMEIEKFSTDEKDFIAEF